MGVSFYVMFLLIEISPHEEEEEKGEEKEEEEEETFWK